MQTVDYKKNEIDIDEAMADSSPQKQQGKRRGVDSGSDMDFAGPEAESEREEDSDIGQVDPRELQAQQDHLRAGGVLNSGTPTKGTAKSATSAPLKNASKASVKKASATKKPTRSSIIVTPRVPGKVVKKQQGPVKKQPGHIPPVGKAVAEKEIPAKSSTISTGKQTNAFQRANDGPKVASSASKPASGFRYIGPMSQLNPDAKRGSRQRLQKREVTGNMQSVSSPSTSGTVVRDVAKKALKPACAQKPPPAQSLEDKVANMPKGPAHDNEDDGDDADLFWDAAEFVEPRNAPQQKANMES